MEAIKVLYVEDEESLGLIIKESMESRGFDVMYCKNGSDAIKSLENYRPDICVLDIMMPRMDGYELAKNIILLLGEIPIFFLTAKSQTSDVLKGFEVGAYDYIKKPFSIEELIVRMKSVLRRGNVMENDDANQIIITIGKYLFNINSQVLIFNKSEKHLTHRESEILRMLCENRNNVLKRNEVLMKLWGDNSFFNARSMDVFITKLRKYLSKDTNVSIVNIRGVGYKIVY